MLTHPRQRQPATPCRDTTTGGALAATSASPLTKKSMTKGQRSFYYLNTDNPRFLPWQFPMKQRTKTPTYRNLVSLGTGETGSLPSTLFLDTHGSSKHPFSPSLCSCYILLSFKDVFSSSRPVLSSPPAFAVAAARTSSSLPLWRPALMPVMKQPRDLYRSTSSSWHSSTMPNARCNLGGGITHRVILRIWSSINFTDLL